MSWRFYGASGWGSSLKTGFMLESFRERWWGNKHKLQKERKRVCERSYAWNQCVNKKGQEGAWCPPSHVSPGLTLQIIFLGTLGDFLTNQIFLCLLCPCGLLYIGKDPSWNTKTQSLHPQSARTSIIVWEPHKPHQDSLFYWEEKKNALKDIKS